MRKLIVPLTLVTCLLAPLSASATPEDGRHWSAQRVTFAVQGGVTTSTQVALETLTRSAGTWNEVGTGPLLEIVEDKSEGEVSVDGVNRVFFIEDTWPYASEQLALTFSHVDSSTGEVLDVDIAVNAVDHKFTSDRSAGTYDLENLLTHELGHALGLEHVDHEDSTLFARIDAGEIQKRDLTEADELTLIAHYEEGFDGAGPTFGCASSGGGHPGAVSALLLLLAAGRRSRSR